MNILVTCVISESRDTGLFAERKGIARAPAVEGCEVSVEHYMFRLQVNTRGIFNRVQGNIQSDFK